MAVAVAAVLALLAPVTGDGQDPASAQTQAATPPVSVEGDLPYR
jgi:hypothetical protein